MISSRSIAKLLLAFLLASAMGCAHRGPTPGLPGATRRGHVVLLRGFHDWYSAGIDALAGELKSNGVDARAYPEEDWENIADALRRLPAGDDQPIVLVGYSYGADDAIQVA